MRTVRIAGLLAGSALLAAPAEAEIINNYTFIPIADTSGPTFSSFLGAPAINNAGTVAFFATLSAGGGGTYTGSGGPTTAIADTSGPFVTFGIAPAINNAGTVAFYAGRHPLEISGIFTGSGGPITTIVDTPGPFSQFSVGLSMNNAGTVTFAAIRNSGGEGIFTGSGGPITTIADTSGPFSLLGTSSINNSGAVVFFAGLDDGGTGIFTGPDPVRDRVIATGDELFGSTVTILFYDHFGLNDAGQIALRIALADRREVMVRADPVSAVPEPASLALFGLGLGGVALYARRRKKA